MTRYLWKVSFRLMTFGTNFDDTEGHPTSYSVGTGSSFTCNKRPGPQTCDLPVSTAGVRNEWSCTSVESTSKNFTFNINFISPQ